MRLPNLDIRTRRLRIRRLDAHDREIYCGLHTDAETMRFISPPLSPERASDHFDRAVRLSYETPMRACFLAMDRLADPCTVGVCSLQHLNLRAGTVEAGMMLHARFRSQGYANEGLTALVESAFGIFEVDEVRVQTSAHHAIAHRLVIGVGFERCGEVFDASSDTRRQLWRIRRPRR